MLSFILPEIKKPILATDTLFNTPILEFDLFKKKCKDSLIQIAVVVLYLIPSMF